MRKFKEGKSVKLLNYYIKYASYYLWILKFNCRLKRNKKDKKDTKDGSYTHHIHDTSSLRYSVAKKKQGLALVLIYSLEQTNSQQQQRVFNSYSWLQWSSIEISHWIAEKIQNGGDIYLRCKERLMFLEVAFHCKWKYKKYI